MLSRMPRAFGRRTIGILTSLFSYLARRRYASVGLAILVEAALLVPLAGADASHVVSIPGVVAAAIAGTVAVVFGPLDGVVVALTGAVLFGFVHGWDVGTLIALAIWPGIVAAAGVFARRVELQREAIRQLVSAHEAERKRVANELHDETAQALAGALLALRQAESAAGAEEAGAANAATRELIEKTIASIRELAVGLRPRALDDFGLPPALERLAEGVRAETGLAVDLDLRVGEDRFPPEAEVTLYRTVQEVLAQIAERDGTGAVQVTLERGPAKAELLVDYEPPAVNGRAQGRVLDLAGLRERILLVGGRLAVRFEGAHTLVRISLPLA